MSERLIAVKGFRMPETCISCPMQFGGWCGVSPPEVDERVATTVDEAWQQKRPQWCPLIEVEAENKMDGGDSNGQHLHLLRQNYPGGAPNLHPVQRV